MPIPPCTEGHDWSEPYTERLRGHNNVLIVRLVKQCLGCKKIVEVYEPAPRLPVSDRIQKIPFELG